MKSFKNKIVCTTAYSLVDLLEKYGVDPVKAEAVVDNFLYYEPVVARPIEIPEIRLQIFDRRKTKQSEYVHVNMAKREIKVLKFLLKRFKEKPLSTVTKKNDADWLGFTKRN